jgi:hypothetical protein
MTAPGARFSAPPRHDRWRRDDRHRPAGAGRPLRSGLKSARRRAAPHGHPRAMGRGRRPHPPATARDPACRGRAGFHLHHPASPGARRTRNPRDPRLPGIRRAWGVQLHAARQCSPLGQRRQIQLGNGPRWRRRGHRAPAWRSSCSARMAVSRPTTSSSRADTTLRAPPAPPAGNGPASPCTPSHGRSCPWPVRVRSRAYSWVGRHDSAETAVTLPVICLAGHARPCQPHVVVAEFGATRTASSASPASAGGSAT